MGFIRLVLFIVVPLGQLYTPVALNTKQLQFVRVHHVNDDDNTSPALPYTSAQLMDDLDCGHLCMVDYPRCLSYIYKEDEHTCYLASSPLHLADVADGTEAHMYAGCDLGRGFQIYTRNNSTLNFCLSQLLPQRTYSQASEICQEMGGYLASAKIHNKMKLLQSIMQNTTDLVWVGLSDQEKEGEFVWEADGSEFGSAKIVAEQFGVPNVLENCVMMRIDRDLDDVDCEKLLHFVCEMMISI